MFKPKQMRAGRMKNHDTLKSLDVYIKLVLAVTYLHVTEACARRTKY